MNSLSRYSKMVVAAVGAVATWAATYFPDNHNVQIAVGLAVALSTVISVYLVPNTPPAGQPSNPKISEQGYALVEMMFALLVLVIIVVILFHFL